MGEVPAVKREVTKFTKEMIIEEPKRYLYATLSADNVPKEAAEELGTKFMNFWEEAQNIVKRSVNPSKTD